MTCKLHFEVIRFLKKMQNFRGICPCIVDHLDDDFSENFVQNTRENPHPISSKIRPRVLWSEFFFCLPENYIKLTHFLKKIIQIFVDKFILIKKNKKKSSMKIRQKSYKSFARIISIIFFRFHRLYNIVKKYNFHHYNRQPKFDKK